MCDIEYEEFDNKESIFQEFKNMLVENQNETKNTNDQVVTENLENIDKQKEVSEQMEVTKPLRMSDLYSNYSSSWKDRLKSRPVIDTSSVMSIDKNDETNDDDIDEDDEDANISDIDLDMSFGETDIIDNAEELKENLEEIGSGGLIDESCQIYESKTKRLPINKITVNSSSCSSDDERIVNLNNKKRESPLVKCSIDARSNPVKKILMETSCDSLTDESTQRIQRENRRPVVRNIAVESFSCSHEDEKNVKKKVEGELAKRVLVETSCASFDDELSQKVELEKNTSSIYETGNNKNALNKVEKSIPRNMMVESSCDSLTDSKICNVKPLNRKTIKNVAVASFSCNLDDNQEVVVKAQPIKTTSTETETEPNNLEKGPNKINFTTQADQMYNSLEEKILPFIRNVNTLELKLKGRLSVFQIACVKQIASQHKLMMKAFGKGRDGFILLRKKLELLNSQKLFLEMKKAEQKQQKERVAIIKAKQEKLANPPKTVSSGCQVDFPDENEPEKESLSKRAARRNRKIQWEMKQKQKLKKNSSSQTIEDGFYICPYCEDDIPEQLQHIHYPFCLEKYRSTTQMKSKSGKDSSTVKSYQPISNQRKTRSKSRDKMNHSKIDSLKKELEKVHNNDINAIVSIVNELDKRCVFPGCNKKKNKTCSVCSGEYCYNHFSPEDQNSEKHFNCPVALEKLETERQKRLGINNPLLKTIEQLTSPRFSDGAMINHKKRVRLVEKPIDNAVHATNDQSQISQNPSPPSLNQTRTRNGPMLSFERNYLRNELRERISLMTDKRSK